MAIIIKIYQAIIKKNLQIYITSKTSIFNIIIMRYQYHKQNRKQKGTRPKDLGHPILSKIQNHCR